eukprot:scaffold52350_cov103-Cyclotella_meneghiniana.AAC.1
MWSGLECFASKGLHRLDFECKQGRKVQMLTQLIKAELVPGGTLTSKPSNHCFWTVPMSHCGYIE